LLSPEEPESVNRLLERHFIDMRLFSKQNAQNSSIVVPEKVAGWSKCLSKVLDSQSNISCRQLAWAMLPLSPSGRHTLAETK